MDAHEFGSLEEANDILALLMRHWNDIVATLSKGEIYLPILLEDENGLRLGNDWARGFMRGVKMCDGWVELMADEEHGGCMVPVPTGSQETRRPLAPRSALSAKDCRKRYKARQNCPELLR